MADEKHPEPVVGSDGPKNDAHSDEPRSDEETVAADKQEGVQAIEAVTTVWSKRALIAAYLMMWIIYFVDSMQQGTTGALTPYVTSSFQEHSLTATTGVMSSIIGGISKLTLAKILDVWGRPQGYAVAIVLCTLGIIMMAACKNVETYAAAQVFYWVGYNGLDYTLSIFIADTSSMRNRSLMFAYASSPYIITTWISGYIAQSVLAGPGFRWGFGAFAIATPAVTTPLCLLFLWNLRKAKKRGLVPPRNSGRSTLQSLLHYAIEFDAVGLLLVSGGLALFLLPFSLYSYQTDGWRSALVISMIIVGGVLLIVFAAWERFWAPVKMLPWELLSDRTVMGACALSATLFVSFYIWDSYFTSFLQVVNGLDVTHATYVSNIYSIGSCFWSIVTGLYIRYTGRFKWAALGFGLPLTVLGVALMINFRQPGVGVGYIAMCQIFIATAGGTLVICEQLAVMAAVPHQYVTIILAVESMFSSVGGAIGQTVAAAIWTGVFPGRLARYLPADAQPDLEAIYGDLATQLSYPMGSPTRLAIAHAYGDAQRYMLIASAAILSIGLAAIFLWRDINVKNIKQVRGNVV